MKYLFLIVVCIICASKTFSQSFIYDGFLNGTKGERLTNYPIPIEIKSIGNGLYVISADGYGGAINRHDTLQYDQYNDWEKVYRYKWTSTTTFNRNTESGGEIKLVAEKTYITKHKLSDFANCLNININTINEDFEINLTTKTVRTMSAIQGFRDVKYTYSTMVPYLNGSLEEKKMELKKTAYSREANLAPISELRPLNANGKKITEEEEEEEEDSNPPKIETENDLTKIDLTASIIVGADSSIQSFTFKQKKLSSELIANSTTILPLPRKSNQLSSYPTQIIKSIKQGSIVKFTLTFNNGHKIDFASSNDFTISYNEDTTKSLRKSNIYYTGVYDFDGDSIDEIILATSTTDYDDPEHLWDVTIEILIYRIRTQDDASQLSLLTIERVGEIKGNGIWGAPRAYIKEKTITIPRNARGFYYAITWDGNKFTDTGNY